MKKAMLLCLLALPAWGGEAELTWKTPYTYCDGTPMGTPSNIRVIGGQFHTLLPGTQTAYTLTGLTPGDWWFAATAIVPGQGTQVEPDESQISNLAFKTVMPGEFVTKTNKVYTFFRTGGNIVLTVTPHTVGVGTVCDATQSVNGKYRVPLEAVTWNGSKLTAALADCG